MFNFIFLLLGPKRAPLDLVEAKASNAANGLETSTFTVCMRVRPKLDFDGDGGKQVLLLSPVSYLLSLLLL
jgi:hypothetical protein